MGLGKFYKIFLKFLSFYWISASVKSVNQKYFIVLISQKFDGGHTEWRRERKDDNKLSPCGTVM